MAGRMARPDMIFAQLGMTLVLVALFCAAVAERLVGQPVFDTNRPVFAAGLGAVGVLVIFVGVVAAKRRQSNRLPDPGRLKRFIEPRFWGFVVILIGMLTFNFEAWGLDLRWLDLRARMEGRVEIVQAREPGETNQISKHAPHKAGPVPAIKIQGIIFKSEHPVVLIDGQSYRVGESVDDAVIQAITRESIVVQIGGRREPSTWGQGGG